MKRIIIVKKTGEVEEKRVKTIQESNVYKYCGYKSSNDVEHLHSFIVSKDVEQTEISYEIYGKTQGKANQENKYELPPPIDTTLYFGNLCIMKKINNSEFVDLTIDEWNKTYEDLFGGFEDIGGENDDDETRSQDTELYDDEEYTSEGYLKDGFVVDDDELLEEDYISYDDDDNDADNDDDETEESDT